MRVKKGLAFVLSVLLALSTLPAEAAFAETETELTFAEAGTEAWDDGYAAAPWDENNVAAVDQSLRYAAVQEMMVDGEEDQSARPAGDPLEDDPEDPDPEVVPEDPDVLPSKFPDYPTEDEILAYLTERYPATRNQTTNGVHYGSCWAHAAAALAEFYMINHGLRDKLAPASRETNYSELQLAYFAYHQCPEPISGPTDDLAYLDLTLGSHRHFLNFGGNLAMASQSLMRQKGYTADADETSYANAENVLADGLADEFATNYDIAYLKNAFYVNLHENSHIIKEAILANGAAGVAYNSDPKYLNSETNAYYNYELDWFNHVVTAVGWDDAYPAENFKELPPGNGAWLIRNSHSTDTRFDEESYFWISYYDTSLAQAAYIYEMADMDKGETYDNQYYYDGQLHSVKSVATTKVANVFVAVKEAEELSAVQFDASENAPGAYRVSIYRNLADAYQPESGTLIEEATTTGTLALAGKYTIPLTNPVPLTLGETFAVVIETEKPIDRECDNLWKEQLNMDVTMHEAESFYFTNGAWVDLAEKSYKGARGNLCIRSLTNDRSEAELPDAVTNLVLHKNTEDGLSLTWSAAKDAEGYEVWRLVEEENTPAEDGSSPLPAAESEAAETESSEGVSSDTAEEDDPILGVYTLIGTTASDVRSFVDTELCADLFCTYKIVPVKGGISYEPGTSPEVRAKRPLPSPKEVVLSESTLTLRPETTWQLTATVLPKKAPDHLTWVSGNEAVCTVSDTGLLTALAEGTATIRAMTDNGVKAYCKVTAAYPHVTEVVLDRATADLIIGENLQLTAFAIPEDAIDTAITWSSSDPSVATVDANGLVTTISLGTCAILAVSANGVRAFCYLSVKLPPVTMIDLDTEHAEMGIGDILSLSAYALPLGAADPEIFWTSSDPEVATVDANGLVTSQTAGACTILAGTANGTRAFCSIVVTPPPVQEVTLSETYVEGYVGRSLTLTATTSPEDAVDATVIWSSSDQWVAAVSPQGFVTINREGSTTITAATANGTQASCLLVASYAHVTKVSLNRTSAELNVGLSVRLTALALPEDAVDRDITWKSSNPKVATVDAKGNVKAVRCGSCTITATAGNGVFAECSVSVKQIFVYACEKDGAYLYTINTDTVKKLTRQGWHCQKAFRAAGKSEKAVYCIYDVKTKRRRYTLSRAKAKAAIKAGNEASFAFYASMSDEVPVYELCKEGKKPTYFYTTSRTTALARKKAGWTYNGVVWYAERTTL